MRQPFEAAEVELVGSQAKEVSRRAGFDHRCAPERLAKLRDLPLYLCDGGNRRGAGVEVIGEPLDRDDPIRIEQQDRERRALLRPPEPNRAVLAHDLQRSQDAELEHGGGP